MAKKIFFKVVKWILILLGFLAVLGYGQVTWLGIKRAWKEYIHDQTEYYERRMK